MTPNTFRMSRRTVYSPYYPENRYVNPNFPFGASKTDSQHIFNNQVVLVKREISYRKTKEEKLALKRAKKQALPFSNLKITL